MMINKRQIKNVVFTGILMLLLNMFPAVSKAQAPSVDDPMGDPDAPIDGGVCLLIAVGIGYGVMKMIDGQKRNTIDLANRQNIA